jgi:hypothetical protein
MENVAIAMRTQRAVLMIAVFLFFTNACTQKATNTLTALQQQQIAPAPQTVTIQLSGYKPAAGRSFQNIFVNNFSVKAAQGKLSYSTARDGMPDSLKQAHVSDYNFSISGPESAIPYFSDLMLYLAGITTTSQNLLYCPQAAGSTPSQTINTSNDGFTYTDSRITPPSTEFLGLRDCDKLYIGLKNVASFDNDGDGIPDYLEIRNGLNPANPGDALLSITGDGVSNLEKVKRGIPVDENADSQPNKLFASSYNIVVQADATRTFTVSNLPIMNGGQDNFIAFNLIELNNVTQVPYLYTAFYILPANSTGLTYKFLFWGSPSGSGNQNVGLTPQ